MSNTVVEKFEIPRVASSYIQVFFEEKDLLLIESVNKEYFTEKDVEVLWGEAPQAYLLNAYKRGVVSHEKDAYKLNNFYGFLDVFVVTQKEKYHREVPREDRIAIDRWYFSAYMNGLDQDLTKRPTEDVILTLDEACEYIDKDDRQLFWTNCDCKCLLGDCGLPTKVCLSYASGDNSYSDRQVSEPVTKEQAKQIMRDADKAGLIHTWNPRGFCNCCGDCCYLFRAQKERGSEHFWPKQNYIISFNEEKCIGCGLCEKRCHFNAPQKSANGNIIFNTDACVGCGICVNACPKQALALIPVEE